MKQVGYHRVRETLKSLTTAEIKSLFITKNMNPGNQPMIIKGVYSMVIEVSIGETNNSKHFKVLMKEISKNIDYHCHYFCNFDLMTI